MEILWHLEGPRATKAQGKYPGILTQRLWFQDDAIVTSRDPDIAISLTGRKYADYVVARKQIKDLLDLGSLSGNTPESVATYLRNKKEHTTLDDNMHTRREKKIGTRDRRKIDGAIDARRPFNYISSLKGEGAWWPWLFLTKVGWSWRVGPQPLRGTLLIGEDRWGGGGIYQHIKSPNNMPKRTPGLLTLLESSLPPPRFSRGRQWWFFEWKWFRL